MTLFRKVTSADGMEKAKEHEVLFVETSARENIGIDELFNDIVETIVDGSLDDSDEEGGEVVYGNENGGNPAQGKSQKLSKSPVSRNSTVSFFVEIFCPNDVKTLESSSGRRTTTRRLLRRKRDALAKQLTHQNKIRAIVIPRLTGWFRRLVIGAGLINFVIFLVFG